ncbi:MAG: Asp-tRNA(Asn)/Glu-tRNA(Gln) amidotransferase subunit GatB [Kiritimatiellia bacterium]|jgi:aspartyl-tRNA(Asn)/glutamyl-tRNA(Gln) amidotransferase subunit B|nr:Asp-tRNA(Asn)/Glu-tRNA(Gln) amidotransferase subunit GatB [Kiritimatiellia bacterium]
MSKYIPSIGLEVHVQLKTRTKMFCACPAHEEGEPNTAVCPICLGLPGAMPLMNREAIRKTVKVGLMIGSEISLRSTFDRKNYFYPDMSKNYQITQQALPLCIGGAVEIEVGGQKKTIRVHHIHQEEDVAKSTHMENSTEIDFNRASMALMELVTEPDMASADEAIAFLTALKEMLIYAGISDCNLEMGHVRCDVNSSIRPAGTDKLGVKSELKNMNTFKGIHRALRYELERQEQTLRAGGTLVQETRRWDDEAGITLPMRSKEYAHDYRYFPEPDLPPVLLTEDLVAAWRAELPELPAVRRARFIQDYNLPEYDAGVLVADKSISEYFEAVAQASGNFKAASNWVMGELLRALGEKGISIAEAKITPTALAQLIGLVDAKTISSTAAKDVFQVLFDEGGDPAAVVKQKGLAQVSDTGAIDSFAAQVIAENAKVAADFQSGKDAALQFLVGQVMKHSRGKANPQLAAEALRKQLST